MAVTVTTQANPLAQKIVKDTSTDNTAATNTTGASGTLYLVEVDNTANGAASYVKFYNTATVTVGTTAPDLIIMVPASSRVNCMFSTGIAFGTAFSHACVTAGGTGGTTSPGSAVVLTYATA